MMLLSISPYLEPTNFWTFLITFVQIDGFSFRSDLNLIFFKIF